MTADDNVVRPDFYTPNYDKWTHWTRVRGCDPSCPACEREAEVEERNAS